MIRFHSHCLTVSTCSLTPIENQIHYLCVANLFEFCAAEFFAVDFCENRDIDELLLSPHMNLITEFVK